MQTARAGNYIPIGYSGSFATTTGSSVALTLDYRPELIPPVREPDKSPPPTDSLRCDEHGWNTKDTI